MAGNARAPADQTCRQIFLGRRSGGTLEEGFFNRTGQLQLNLRAADGCSSGPCVLTLTMCVKTDR